MAVVGVLKLGPSGIFRIAGYSCALDRTLKLPPRDTANFDFVQLARDSFGAMGRQEQPEWPSVVTHVAERGYTFLCVHYDASSLMAADVARRRARSRCTVNLYP